MPKYTVEVTFIYAAFQVEAEDEAEARDFAAEDAQQHQPDEVEVTIIAVNDDESAESQP